MWHNQNIMTDKKIAISVILVKKHFQGTSFDTRRSHRRNVNRGGKTMEAFMDSETHDSAASSSTETTWAFGGYFFDF